MDKQKFRRILDALHKLHGLSKDEAYVLLNIIAQGNVTASEVSDILNRGKLSNSASRPYQILASLESKDMVFEDHNSKKIKKYKAIHPRQLLVDLKQDWTDIETEVGFLEQLRETPDYEDEDPVHSSQIHQSEGVLVVTINELQQDGCELSIILSEESRFKEKLKKYGLKVEKGKMDVVLIENKAKAVHGVIWLAKRTDKKGDQLFYGNQIMDKSWYEFVKREVKK